MVRLIGLYFLGAIFVLFILPRAILFIVPKVFEIVLVTVQTNDLWLLGLRLFLSFTFGYCYTFFKIEKLYGINSLRKFYVISGILICALFLIPFGEVLVQKFTGRYLQVYVSSLSKLWVTFPVQILVIGLTLKFVFKENRIKWLW